MIAISYRREDTAPITGRIYDRLQAVFGRDRVFMDLDSIPFGVDFRTHISESLSRCDTLLVVIGRHWLGVSADGSRRIDDPTDFVRLEVAQAPSRDVRIIPLLIDRTEMPSSTVLPDDLKNLAFRNALRVDSGADFHHHINRPCSSLQPAGSSSGPPARSYQPGATTPSPPAATSSDSRPSIGDKDTGLDHRREDLELMSMAQLDWLIRVQTTPPDLRKLAIAELSKREAQFGENPPK